METDFPKLLNDTVIKNGYCIGCGVCTTVKNSPLSIKLDGDGKYQAVLDDEYDHNVRVDKVCPFSENAMNEDEVSDIFFQDMPQGDQFIGKYDSLFAGFVNESDFRINGSSGGFGSWIAEELIKRDLIDAVVHVKESESALFRYNISHSTEDLRSGSKSRYYPIEMSEVIDYVLKYEGRYLLVGVPCFIKSIRLLSLQNEIIKGRIHYTLALVCGHLKSSFYSKMIAWDLGITPDKDFNIDFREKDRTRKASDYSSKVIRAEDNSITIKRNKEIFGTTWGYGFFKYKACDYCDDVLGETADMTIGDAWLPQYEDDALGTNIIITRNPEITKILKEASNQERITLFDESEKSIFTSQAGGFRHRRDGLAYRLYHKSRRKKWVPKKRVSPSNNLRLNRKLIYLLREVMVSQSYKSFKVAMKIKNFKVFKLYMSIFIYMHKLLTRL